MYHTTLVWIAQSCLLGHLEKVQKIVPPQKVVSYILKAEVPGVKTPPIFLIFRQILGSERETH